MRWAEISVEASATSEDAVADILMDEGCGGTASQRSANATRVLAYLPVDDRLEARLESIRCRVRSLPGLGLHLETTEIGVGWVEDDGWTTAYRSFFKPIRLGRVTITPSWQDYRARDGETVLQIDPGMAFGTGHHETTRLCLLALQDHVRGGETVLDVGTGSGILAIAAAKLGAARVVGVDIDPVAARVAAGNVERNGLVGRIEILTGDSPLVFDGVANIVLANIVPDVIISMAPDLRTKLKPGGKLVTSGIVQERVGDVRKALESLGLAAIEQAEDGDWVALVSERAA